MTPKQRYALRAALRFAWSHYQRNNAILKCECRERGVEPTPGMLDAFLIRNHTPWNDPAAFSRPLDKHGQPIWNEGRIDRLRREAWIKAVEARVRD